MRPEITSWRRAVSGPRVLTVPDVLLHRARDRRIRRKQAAQRAQEVGQLAHRALVEILRAVDSGALTCAAGDVLLPELEQTLPVAKVTPHSPGPLAIAFDYRPTAAGRLQSRLARRVSEDSKLLGDAQAALQSALNAVGFGCLFHTHLVQKYVAAGERGYHVTVRVQVLVALTRLAGAQGSTV